MKQNETVDQVWSTKESQRTRSHPGLVLIHSGQKPRYEVLTLPQPRTLGRGEIGGVDDNCLSRKHAEVAFAGGRFEVRDLESRNGTFLDGKRLKGEARVEQGLLRVGDTLFLLSRDVTPFEPGRIELPGGGSAGATLRGAWEEISEVATEGETLHLTGETGSGKEVAARLFHQKSPRAKGPFVAVNCAAIPTGVAERLLFGAKKGAYSGAEADAEGYLQTAHTGTLFLDEVAELDLEVQAKLLRVLETREVLPLGAAKPVRVEMQLVSATHHALRDRVDAGKFREDLFFRLGRPHVAVPPLRERREDIPWLLDAALRGSPSALPPHASLVEAALLRSWPGNVRELMTEARDAARRAAGRRAQAVEAIDLAPTAGLARGETAVEREPVSARDHAREDIEAALQKANGNVTRAARALGLHRNQVRRFISENQIDLARFGGSDEED